jgi:SHS2 domain-containing protein
VVTGEGRYRFAEHSGEVEIELEGPTERDVFAAALAAVAELMATDGDHAAAERVVDVTAHERSALLVGWINELVMLAERDGFVAHGVRSFDLGENRLRAVLSGRIGPTRDLVKAATLHGLELGHGEGGWRGRVVVDV